MITVLGATGNTGGRVAETLLARGEKVRAVGRDAARLKALGERGAEIAVGDASDAAFLARAFAGAEAAYTLIPPHVTAPDVRAHQDAVGTATASALRQAKVGRVVLLSSVGAQVPSGTGPIAGVHAQEARLRELGVDALFLRPAYFMENLFASLPLIKHQGINGGALKADLVLPMIATRDIADAAADALAKRDWKGVAVRDLLGPRDYTLAEVTALIGQAIGKPDLAYVQFPYADFAGALTQAGLSPDMARLFAEMTKAFNEGVVAPPARTAANSTPTTFESFVGALAGAYRAL